MKRPSALDTLGGRLKAARERVGLTQIQLADAADVNQSDVTKLERGKKQTTAALARLAAAVGVDPLWLELRRGDDPSWTSSASEPAHKEASVNPPTESAVIHVNLLHPEAAVLLRMVRASKLPGVTVEMNKWKSVEARPGIPGRRQGDHPAPHPDEPASLTLVSKRGRKERAK